MAGRSGGATLVLLLIASLSSAASDPLAKCCSSKLRAAGSREQLVFRCHAKAAAQGAAVDPACVAAAGAGLEQTFGRLEDGGTCAGTGDGPLVRADLERIVAGIANALRPQPAASGCAARKLKAAARLASGALKAFAKLAPHPADHLDELDPVVTELSHRLEETFARLEGRGGCLTMGDAASVALAVITGASAPLVPDGVLLTSLRACGRCGDSVRGGGEDCDGFDSFSCPGTCTAACTCRCGDGVKNGPNEVCDGADADACQGLCRPDCTCPPPACGNGVKEAGEQCDGTALGGCLACQPDCTCIPPVCGNGVVEPGEECDGSDFGNSSNIACLAESPGVPGCRSDCHCCALGICEISEPGNIFIECCPGYTCPARVPAPHSVSFCRPSCSSDADCAPGQSCFQSACCSQVLCDPTLGCFCQ